MTGYWMVSIYSVYGTDLRAFDTREEAVRYATEAEEDSFVYGSRIKWEEE